MKSLSPVLTWREHFKAWWQELSELPWRQMLSVLAQRFREARLGVSASSLTFTTVLALVPLFVVALSVFAAFPLFGKFQDTIQRWLIDSLVPESISRQVLSYLTQFSRKASRLGSVGLVAVVMSAVFLMVTIERTLGQIWRIERQRPLAQRVLLYWSAITLGPLFLGASLAITSYVVTASRDVVDVLPGIVRWLLDGIEFFLLIACVSGLYFYVPFTRVQWRHAVTAGVLVAGGIELAKKLLAVYLMQFPTYSIIYGAFAAVPILLVWIYVMWVIVLLGAVLAASMPEVRRQQLRQPDGPGWDFRVTLEVLSALHATRQVTPHGLTADALSVQLRLDVREVNAVLEVLRSLDWVGLLREEGGSQASRHVLLINPAVTQAGPLANRLLVLREAASYPFWMVTGLDQTALSALLPMSSNVQSGA
jgi:membrane protein